MNRMILIGFAFITIVSNCFSLSVQDFLGISENTIRYRDLNEFRSIQFSKDNTAEFLDDERKADDALWNNKFQYELRQKDNFLFLDLQIQNKKRSYMVLLSDICLIVYNAEDSKPIFSGVSKGSPELYYFPAKVQASSELVEGTKTYYAKNLSNYDLDEPWAVKGFGIGENVSFSCNAEEMIICTGYISTKKNYLWSQNSRPKSIQVIFKKSRSIKRFELADSPNPQIVDWGFVYSGEMEISILDVYHGSKYDDTCIHSMMLKY